MDLDALLDQLDNSYAQSAAAHGGGDDAGAADRSRKPPLSPKLSESPSHARTPLSKSDTDTLRAFGGSSRPEGGRRRRRKTDTLSTEDSFRSSTGSVTDSIDSRGGEVDDDKLGDEDDEDDDDDDDDDDEDDIEVVGTLDSATRQSQASSDLIDRLDFGEREAARPLTAEQSAENAVYDVLAATTPQSREEARQRMEDHLVEKLNDLRENPVGFAELLTLRWLPRYDGKTMNVTVFDGRTMSYETKEGVKACEEAIATLRRTSPCKPLKKQRGMTKAVNQALAEFEKVQGQLPSCISIINDFGVYSGKIEECVALAEFADATDIILHLLVDDGDKSRFKQKILLHGKHRHVAAGVRLHPQYGYVALLVLAERFF